MMSGFVTGKLSIPRESQLELDWGGQLAPWAGTNESSFVNGTRPRVIEVEIRSRSENE